MRTAAVAGAALALAAPAPTTSTIRVFSDQLPDGMPPALVRFAAAHYAGAQKLGAGLTDALRRENPQFFAIQYRLALGLGRRTQLRFGDRWLPEWPPRPAERWFFHYGGRRVLMRQWGWYVMNVDDTAWRSYYTAQLRRQVASTHADGAFLDSASVPNEFGGSAFTPRLPDVDARFESAWTARIGRWLPYVQRRLGKPVIANAGSWVTTRDRTDYSGIAGVMLEGFATNLAPADWRLELTRALGLVRRDRIVIAQSYPGDDVKARMFDLGSYLLIKGSHTYVNFPLGIEVDWFPEYAIELGAPVDPPGLRDENGVFVRRFANGLVAVNPGDGPLRFDTGGSYDRVMPQGGGRVPDSGMLPADWRLTRSPATSVVLGPREAAVLLH